MPEASMILSGMGPVDRMETTTAKLFAALYALFCGLVFIGVIGVGVARGSTGSSNGFT